MVSSSKASGQNYAYGYGRVGILQQYLLNQGDIDRLVGAHDEKQLFRVIAELNLVKNIEFTDRPSELIKRLEIWLQKETRSMASSEGTERVFDILWLRTDAALISYLLKQHHGLTSVISEEPDVTATAFDPDALRLLIKHGEIGPLPTELIRFINQVKGRKNPTPQEIDDAVAMFMAQEQVLLADLSGSDYIRRYVAHHIDLQNVRTARRLRQNDRPEDHLIPGGRIPPSQLSADPKQLAILIRSSYLPSELADYLADTEEASVALERALAHAIARDIAAMRNQVLNLEPIFAFGAIAQSQLKVLRTIIIAKTMGLSNEELRLLLPPFLSASPFTS